MKTMIPVLLILILCWQSLIFGEVVARKTITRNLEPFTFEGSAVKDSTIDGKFDFFGKPLANLFAFVYHADTQTWEQIPLQIDEKDGSSYKFSGISPTFNEKNEIAVMVNDLGDRVTANTWIDDEDSKKYPRFEIRAFDTGKQQVGWFYLYFSETYQNQITKSYVKTRPDSINGIQGRQNIIFSDQYIIGHEGRGIMDFMHLQTENGLPPNYNMIDRQKLRLKGKVNYSGLTKDYNESEDKLNLVKMEYITGPVRVIQKIYWRIVFSIPPIQYPIDFDLTKTYYRHSVNMYGRPKLEAFVGCQLVRISIDIHKSLGQSGIAYFQNSYNKKTLLNKVLNPEVNMKLDIPGTFWALVSSVNGSFLQTLTIDNAIGKYQHLYYWEGTGANDGSNIDTGDMESWGDLGVVFSGDVIGNVNLATNLFLFPYDADSLDAAQLSENQNYPIVWWSGLFAQVYDVTPPEVAAIITDSAEENAVKLIWNAPHEDGTSGNSVALYEMRYSTESPDEIDKWWKSALPVPVLPIPGAPGARDSVVVDGLERNTTYYFVLRSQDRAGNWSDFSAAAATQTTPVELAAFKYALDENGVRLTWQTSTESNNYGFELQRKSENSDFSAIAFIEGAGTTQTPQNYSFLDRNLPVGRYAYRLKQVDTNGQFELSQALNVVVSGPSDFKLAQNYPNPFNSETNFNFAIKAVQTEAASENSFDVELIIYNLLGQKVKTLLSDVRSAGFYSMHWNGTNEFNEKVASGLYMYRLTVSSQKDGREVYSKMRKLILLP